MFYDAKTITDATAQGKWEAAGYAKYDSSTYEITSTYTTGADFTTSDYSNVFDGSTTTSDGAKEIAKASFKDFKDATIKAVEAISLDAYSKEYKGNAKSNYVLASEAKTAALRLLDEVKVTATTPAWSDYATAITAVKAIYEAPVNQGDPKGTLYTWGSATTFTTVTFADSTTADVRGLNYIGKIADEPTEEAKLAFAKSLVITNLTTIINKELNDTVTKLNNELLDLKLNSKSKPSDITAKEEAIAKAKEAAAAAIEIVTYLVNDTKDYNLLIQDKANGAYSAGAKFVAADAIMVNTNWGYTATTGDSDITNDSIGVYSTTQGKAIGYALKTTTGDMNDVFDVINHIADLKEEAELAKLSVYLDGDKVVEIEKALEKAIDKTYKGTKATLEVGTVTSNLYNRQEALISDATVKVGDRKYQGVDKWDDTLATEYDEDYFDAVRAVVKDTKAAIRDTKTIAEAEAAFLAGLEKLEAIPDKADKIAYQATKEYRDAKDDYIAKIKAHAASVLKYLNETDTAKNYDLGTSNANWDAMIDNVVADLSDAYNAEALTAAYNDAISTIDTLKTKAELNKAKEDLLKRINDLPSSATIADKATVQALRADLDAHNDYCELVLASANQATYKVTLITKLTNAENAIVQSEIKALQDQYDAIMKDSKVTDDEAAAVAKLRDDYDAFVASYLPENYTSADETKVDGYFTTYASGDMKAPETAISALEAKVQENLVKAFKTAVAKLDVNNIDTAAVKAARAMYDALERDTKYGAPHYVYQSDAYDKLVALEKVLIDDVEALKITASSSAKKGSITIKWTVKGNADAATAYEIWKSTKKNSGFKKSFTTKDGTKRSYKNTKGLKKGTRYYYKVRAIAYDANGKKITSDWSNKAYRKAK